MKTNEKRLFVKLLNQLVNDRELAIYDPKNEELLSGEDISIVCMKGDVIHICLSGSIFVIREKKEK